MKTPDGKEITEKLLLERFPLCFADRNRSMQETAMCWGLECGEGWRGIIYDACSKAEPLITKWLKENPEENKQWTPRLSQVKEKYGTLRMYWSSYPPGLDKIEAEAETKSETTCETCGKEGKVRGHGWLYTACWKHTKEEDRDNLEMVEQAYISNKKKKLNKREKKNGNN